MIPFIQLLFPVEAFFTSNSFREAFRATRAILVLELFGGCIHLFSVIQKHISAFLNLMSPLEEVLEPLEVIFTSNFFREAFKATKTILVLELFGGCIHLFSVIQKPTSAVFNLLSPLEDVSEPLEVIFTSNSFREAFRATRAI